MKECVIISHLGLGDLILISGLAVHLAERYDVVRFPCRTQDQNSVRSFFFLQPRIMVYSFNADSTTPANYPVHTSERHPHFFKLGFYASDPMDRSISFSENFYRQAYVDYSVRWDKCPLQEVVNKFYGGELECYPAIDFVHDSEQFKFRYTSRFTSGGHGMQGPPISWIKPKDNRSSILSYATSIKIAEEIHVIDGPFLHLAESIETTGDLYYHRYARPLSARWNDIDCPTRKKWNVLTQA